MARLVVNPDSPDAWTVELGQGSHSLGRDAVNAVILDHPSIGGQHAELVIDATGAVLQDLGTLGGSLVDGLRIERSRLRSGSDFNLGEVTLRLLEDMPAVGMRGNPATPGPVRMRVPLPEVDFHRTLPGAFLYPFKGNGPILIVTGGAFFLVLGWLPFIGLLITGYLFAYAKRLVSASAGGEDLPPDWPDFTNWYDDILAPYGQMIALMLLTFLPSALLSAFLPEDLPLRSVWVWATFAYGVFLAPMGMLALAMLDSVTALNPIALVWSITRILKHYLVAALLFGVVIGTTFFSEEVLETFSVPLLSSVLAGFLNLYLAAVAMRVLGLLYRARKDDLGW